MRMMRMKITLEDDLEALISPQNLPNFIYNMSFHLLEYVIQLFYFGLLNLIHHNWFQNVTVDIWLWWWRAGGDNKPTLELATALICSDVSLLPCCLSGCSPACLRQLAHKSNLRDHWACRPISLHVRLQNKEIHGISAWFAFVDRPVTGNIERQGFLFTAPWLTGHVRYICSFSWIKYCTFNEFDFFGRISRLFVSKAFVPSHELGTEGEELSRSYITDKEQICEIISASVVWII